MSDDRKINEADWERISQEQVAGYFKSKGLTGDELETAVAEKVEQIKNSLHTYTLSTDGTLSDPSGSGDGEQTDIINNLVLDIGRQLALDDLRTELASDLAADPNYDEDARDKLISDFDGNQERLMRAAEERRRAQQEALKKRLGLRKKLEAQGIEQSEIENVLNKYDQQLVRNADLVSTGQSEFVSLDDQTDLDLNLEVELEKDFAKKMKKVEIEAKKESKKSKLSKEDAQALMEKMKQEEQQRQAAEKAKRSNQKQLLDARLAAKRSRAQQIVDNEAELIAIKEAEQLKSNAEAEKRLGMLEVEKEKFNLALATGELDPNQVYKILSKRHAEESKELKRKYAARAEIEADEKKAEIRREREKERNRLFSDNDIQQFDKETEALLLAIDKSDSIDDEMELVNALGELNLQQMKEVEEALLSFNPEAAARIQFELEMKSREKLEADSRQATRAVMEQEYEKQKAEKLKKLKEIENEKKRIEAESEAEIEAIRKRDEEKQKQRKEIEEKRAQSQAKRKLEKAETPEDQQKILTELERQKTKINSDLIRRRKAQEERLKVLLIVLCDSYPMTHFLGTYKSKARSNRKRKDKA